ncbi:hypothetical protein ACFPRL_22695 [Pseudoclavibacter helvolus]
MRGGRLGSEDICGVLLGDGLVVDAVGLLGKLADGAELVEQRVGVARVEEEGELGVASSARAHGGGQLAGLLTRRRGLLFGRIRLLLQDRDLGELLARRGLRLAVLFTGGLGLGCGGGDLRVEVGDLLLDLGDQRFLAVDVAFGGDDILPGGVVVIRGERGTSGERKRGQNGGGCCTDERGTPAVAESQGLSAPGGGHSLSSW